MYTGLTGEPVASDLMRSDWVFLLLIIPVLIYLFVSFYEKYSLVRIIKIVFSNKFASTAYRSIAPGAQLFQSLLGLISLMSIASFILFCELFFNLEFFGLSAQWLWVSNFAAALIAISLRYTINYLLGKLSGSWEVFSEYFFNISRNYKLIGIFLMLMNFFISYLEAIPDKYLIYSSLIVMTIILFFRFIRLFYLFIKRRFSLFYLILYLCALEIFPVLILIKYLSGQEY